MKRFIQKIISKVTGKKKAYIPLLRLEGMIGGKLYGKKGISFDKIKESLTNAFEYDKNSEDVILILNSPGGSPTQSSLIYQHILYLKKKHDKKLSVFIEDMAASGGYYIACAGDKIYADHHSITGSIGVVSGGFGFVDAIKKIGIERRVHTSGTNKSMLDPFTPEKKEDVEHLKSIQEEIHTGFKKIVQTARGDKLQNPEENEIFTGKFWVSETAQKLGLIDEINTVEAVFDKKYEEDYEVVSIELDKRGFLEKRLSLYADILGDQFSHSIIQNIENRLHKIINFS